MRSCRSILLAFPLFAVPAALAAGMPPAMHGGHDHAAMARPAAWTTYPMLKTRMNGKDRDSMVVSIVPQNIVADHVDAWSNDLKNDSGRRELALEMGGAKLDKPASGGFHWLAVREEQEDRVLVASTVYYFGERGAQDPTAMFLQQKHELEIIPQPYPREHSRYRANETWKFLMRFNGQPLVNQRLALETANGSRTEFVSDAQGVSKVHLPDDFKAEEAKQDGAAHSHGVRSADFVLTAQYAAGGKTYVTAFNGSYGPDAFDKRSLALGLGFVLLGMAGAAPLLRNRKQKEASHA